MRYSTKWLFDEYVNMFEQQTGATLTKEEAKFLKDYFNILKESGSKKIYYLAVFKLKRGYPQFLVYFFIKIAIKKDFSKDENLKSLVKLHKYFAEKMLFDAIKAYCKISD